MTLNCIVTADNDNLHVVSARALNDTHKTRMFFVKDVVIEKTALNIVICKKAATKTIKRIAGTTA